MSGGRLATGVKNFGHKTGTRLQSFSHSVIRYLRQFNEQLNYNMTTFITFAIFVIILLYATKNS